MQLKDIFQAPYAYVARNPEYTALVERKLLGQHFMRHNGFDLIKIEPGYIEGYGPLSEFNKQQDGLIHGGMISTVADIVTGFAAFTLVSKDDRVVTSNLNVSYFSPGRGEGIFARGWVTKPGSRLQYCEGEVYAIQDGQPHLIAKCNAIMAVILGKNKEVQGLEGSK